ncbi:hypothetical protein SAMN05421819_3948 [Bryocella elongata]|uniref:Outer membrane protein beta-barrel domain-containing protein n=1 Tax=Bryocella elongata TaxID=863522 RepID=A0A1H6BRP2_9BACT|nr:hypothetical protein [Bryocella elongata]SEG63135.1 hypothetical protein SAMN05421819_3948 [Bryocella elongata]
MKLSGLMRIALLFGSSMLLCHTGVSQAPPSGGGAYLDSSTNWDFSLGGSYARVLSGTSTGNVGGWNATLANFPYDSHPWIGAMVDLGGYYVSQPGKDSQYYSVMGGPAVTLRVTRIQPYARVMLGRVLKSASNSTTASTNGQGMPRVLGSGSEPAADASTTASTGWQGYFGLDAGGGLDYPITSRCAVRLEADWTPFWVNSQRQNNVRAAVGLDWRF